jgi:flagellar export protein FliJ
VTDRFHSILKLSEISENSAAKTYVDAKQVFESNQSRLDELKFFMNEYHDGSDQATHNPQSYQSTRVFLSQLSQAIDQQELDLSTHREQMLAEEAQWRVHRVKRRSIETLMDKRNQTSLKLQDKREQNDADELARQMGASRSVFDKI